jgi:hypothetical protein
LAGDLGRRDGKPSGGYNNDIFFQNPCLDTGQALVADGTITTFQCRWGSNGPVALWVIV